MSSKLTLELLSFTTRISCVSLLITHPTINMCVSLLITHHTINMCVSLLIIHPTINMCVSLLIIHHTINIKEKILASTQECKNDSKHLQQKVSCHGCTSVFYGKGLYIAYCWGVVVVVQHKCS